ncbi:cytochrome P450 [Hypoxylon argillaceum]|nr:cytochrome P450 [Hypoxylon argillaceum]
MNQLEQFLPFLLRSLVVTLVIRSIYRLYFHPLSKYPGPAIAAISAIWLSGRWPWIIEDALNTHGDVVRIAPNELVFVRPQALSVDIYGAYHQNIELFPKTQINNHGSEERGGLIWEWDPVRHRQVAKQISPAFSGRALRAKEPALHRYTDLFIQHMISDGQDDRGHSHARLEQRIRQRGVVEHLDFIEQIIPEDREPPSDPKEMRHLEQVVGQLLVVGYEPPSVWLYGALYHLMKEKDTLHTVTSLAYFTACLKEGFRILPNTASSHGRPCISPGTTVDGNYVPRGVVCQSSTFTLARRSKYFVDPLHFRPARWLPQDHALYDSRFSGDDVKGYRPFSQGPLACMGKDIAWWQARLFLAKVLWKFDPELVPGQEINIDKNLRVYGLYIKPEVRVRFIPSNREGL